MKHNKHSTTKPIPSSQANYDVIIIGGGFYGASLALALKRYYSNIVILEKASKMLTQASYVNQATIHNGYHYPRSYLTAIRSKTNFPVFVRDFSEAMYNDYERIYAVASIGSKVTAKQFENFCHRIHVPIEPADHSVKSLFNPSYVDGVFRVKEYAFRADKLAEILTDRLKKAKIEVLLETEVERVLEDNGKLCVRLTTGENIYAKEQVLSCIYGNTNALLERSGLQPLPLKCEMTEVALISVPNELKKLGITVIDGPFFATMPFPMTKYHSLTHVRYTPQKTFVEGEKHESYVPKTNFRYMIHDAVRYLPVLEKAKYQSSLFTIKTVLPQHERDDGRPILYKKDYGLKGFSVVLGGKIDNIYDILTAMKL